MAVSTPYPRPAGMHDDALIMKAAGLIVASAAVATIIDTGPGAGYRVGCVDLNITAVEIASTDELYDIVVQGSNSATFATASGIVDLASIPIAAAAVNRTDSDYAQVVGNRRLMFDNADPAGNVYRYIRLYTVVAGTITTGINYSARLTWIKLNA